MAKKQLKSPKKRKGSKYSKKKQRFEISGDLELEYSNTFPILFKLAGAITFLIGLAFFKYAVEGVYLDLGLLLISLFLLSGAVACLYFINKKEIYIFSKERQQIIEQKRGKTAIYPFDSVIGFYDIKYDVGEELILETKTKVFRFSSFYYLNYHNIKEFLKQNFQTLNPKVYQRYYMKKLYLFILVGIIAILTGLWYGTNPNEPILSELKTTTITLSEKPKYVRAFGKSRNHRWEFKAKEYPEFTIKIPTKETKIDVEKFSKNDKIGIIVKKEILEMKLLKTKEPTFRMKHFGWENVFVEDLKVVSR